MQRQPLSVKSAFPLNTTNTHQQGQKRKVGIHADTICGDEKHIQTQTNTYGEKRQATNTNTNTNNNNKNGEVQKTQNQQSIGTQIQGRKPPTKPLLAKETHETHHNQTHQTQQHIKPEQMLQQWQQKLTEMEEEEKGSNKQHLIQAYTTALQQLRSPEIANSTQLMALWVRYAELTDVGPAVFSTLEALNLGRKLAMVHLGHASWLESQSIWDAADKVYIAALVHQAQPLEQIIAAYDAFKQRWQAYEVQLSVAKIRQHPHEQRRIEAVTMQSLSTPVVQSSNHAKYPSTQQVSQATSRADERCAWNASILVDENGEELSFEEVRARRALLEIAAMQAKPQPLPSSSKKPPPLAKRSILASDAILQSPVVLSTPKISAAHHSKMSSSQRSSNVHAVSQHTMQPSFSMQSPTIFTKAALNDVEGMFQDGPVITPKESNSTPSNDFIKSKIRPSPVAFSVFNDDDDSTHQSLPQIPSHISMIAPSSEVSTHTHNTLISMFKDPIANATNTLTGKLNFLDEQSLHHKPERSYSNDHSQLTKHQQPQSQLQSQYSSLDYPHYQNNQQQQQQQQPQHQKQLKQQPHQKYAHDQQEQQQDHSRKQTQLHSNAQQAYHEHAPREDNNNNTYMSGSRQSLSAILETSNESERSSLENRSTESIADPTDVSAHARLLKEVNIMQFDGVVNFDKKQLPLRALLDGDEQDLELGSSLLHIEERLDATETTVRFKVQDVDSQVDCYLSVCSPPLLWEFYVGHVLRARVPTCSNLLVGEHAYLFDNCSCTVAPLLEGFTLQEALDAYQHTRTCMDDVLVLYYALELNKLVYAMHRANIVHTRLDASRLIIKDVEVDDWSEWNVAGKGGWSQKGLCLTDFRAAVDCTLFTAGTRFYAGAGRAPSWQTTTDQSWTVEADLFNMCNIITLMLTHHDLQIIHRDGVWVPNTNTHSNSSSSSNCNSLSVFWTTIFEALLNCTTCTDSVQLLSRCQHELESILVQSNQRSKVKLLLYKQRILLMEHRQKRHER